MNSSKEQQQNRAKLNAQPLAALNRLEKRRGGKYNSFFAQFLNDGGRPYLGKRPGVQRVKYSLIKYGTLKTCCKFTANHSRYFYFINSSWPLRVTAEASL